MDLQKKGRNFKSKDARFKACLVATGYTQKEGVDFNEVFSLIIKRSSIRVLLVMIALFRVRAT